MNQAFVSLNYQELQNLVTTLERTILAKNDMKLLDAGKKVLSIGSSNYTVGSFRVVLEELASNIVMCGTALLSKDSVRRIQHLRRNANVVLELRRALELDVERIVELKDKINSRLEELLQPQGVIYKFNNLNVRDVMDGTQQFKELTAQFNHHTFLTKMDKNEIDSILTKSKSRINEYMERKNGTRRKGKVTAVCGAGVAFACTIIGIFIRSIVHASGSRHQDETWIWVIGTISAMFSLSGILVAYKNREDSQLRNIMAEFERVQHDSHY